MCGTPLRMTKDAMPLPRVMLSNACIIEVRDDVYYIYWKDDELTGSA